MITELSVPCETVCFLFHGELPLTLFRGLFLLLAMGDLHMILEFMTSPLHKRLFFTGLGSISQSESWFDGIPDLSATHSAFRSVGGISGTQTSSFPRGCVAVSIRKLAYFGQN